MRVLACLIPLIAIAAAPAGQKPKPPTISVIQSGLPKAGCPNLQVTPAEGDAQAPKVHSLGREPGARQEIAVLHTDENGCIKPIVVRDDVGGKSPLAVDQ